MLVLHAVESMPSISATDGFAFVSLDSAQFELCRRTKIFGGISGGIEPKYVVEM